MFSKMGLIVFDFCDMKTPEWLEKIFHLVVDLWFAAWPQPVPARTRLRDCKIISHRGEHDNRRVFENTLAAFERACKAGVWGLEFDLRWTKDLRPVVVHDSDLRRVFQKDLQVRQLTLHELQSRCPLIPSLAKVIHLYGGKVHLMMELKAEVYPEPELQSRALQAHLRHLRPQADYHFISLEPALLAHVDWCPRAACLPIAQLNVKAISTLALQAKFGGMNGHYLLVNNTVIKRHLHDNQRIGTGFVRSGNSLFREINRGVEWIYTNHAVRLQKIRAAFLK
mgnify:CR=1 FL=1